nr:hypothetical protein [Tanacetum cinerariifolium]
GPTESVCGHAHRFAQLPVVSAPRVLPPHPVQPAGPRRGKRRAARRGAALARRAGRAHLLRQRQPVFRL